MCPSYCEKFYGVVCVLGLSRPAASTDSFFWLSEVLVRGPWPHAISNSIPPHYNASGLLSFLSESMTLALALAVRQGKAVDKPTASSRGLFMVEQVNCRTRERKEFVVEAIFGQDHKLLVSKSLKRTRRRSGRTTRPVTDAAKSTTAPAARLKPTESTRRTNEGLSNTSTSKAKKLPESTVLAETPGG
ncbi:hypothetical protein C8R44DRAFT_750258 [Mycena epipterygia]|nr:hypothetical protein C8R44DRAFT_750258 [Mycena epipterygia]